MPALVARINDLTMSPGGTLLNHITNKVNKLTFTPEKTAVIQRFIGKIKKKNQIIATATPIIIIVDTGMHEQDMINKRI